MLINLDTVLVKPEPQCPGFVAELQVGNTMSLGCQGPLPLPWLPLPNVSFFVLVLVLC